MRDEKLTGEERFNYSVAIAAANGNGHKSDLKICPMCKGAGLVPRAQDVYHYTPEGLRCAFCKGKGVTV